MRIAWTTLDQYIGGSIVRGCLLVMLILIGLFSFLELVDEVDDVGKGDYEMRDALAYVLLMLPERTLDLIPVAVLIGSVMALGALMRGSELLVMQASGVSPMRILTGALKTAVFLMFLVFGVEQFVAPPLAQQAHTQRQLALAGAGSIRTEHGFWSREGKQFINVDTMSLGRIPMNVSIYHFSDEGDLRQYIRARYADTSNTRRWVLIDVTEKRIGEYDLTVRHHARLVWDSFLKPEQLGILVLPPESLSLTDLYQYIRYLERSGQKTDRYELALWDRLSLPLATGAMVLLAVPFVFGSPRRQTAGRMILIGTLVGVGFYLLDQIVSYLSLLDKLVLPLSPPWVKLAPVFLILVAALLLLRRL